jgi:hypothetical protein
MIGINRIGNWIWASADSDSARARERRLPVWEYLWFTRLYRICIVLGWCAVVAFFLIWNLVWATP